LDTREYDLLRLVKQHGPIGSIRLHDLMELHGYSIQDRTIRLMLADLDEQGYTAKVSGKGRRLTPEGQKALTQENVTGRLEQIRTRIATLTSKVTYDPIEERHDMEIFTREKPKATFENAYKANRHIYDYVFTESKNERKFVEELDTSTEVVVYAKLPGGFSIPTPVGNYNPDWAIAFQEGEVKHIYFIAETKGSMSTMELREIEQYKIQCARKFFVNITSDEVKYDVIDGYDKLMELVA
jgi:restriction endonuclease